MLAVIVCANPLEYYDNRRRDFGPAKQFTPSESESASNCIIAWEGSKISNLKKKPGNVKFVGHNRTMLKNLLTL